MTIATDLTDKKTSNVPPRFEGDSQQCVTAHLGDDVTLTMQLAASGGLPTTFIWTRGDQELSGDRYRFSENNNTVLLSLQHVTEDDVGYYTLIAKNAAGEARRAVELKLDEGGVDAPVFLRRLSDLAVKVGTRTRFLVEIRSSSDIKVTWYHNDHLVQEGERFTFLHEGNFFCVDVAPVMVEDGGRWTCMAENTTGRSSCSSHLNVLVPKAYKSPEFLEELKALLTEQGTVSLECKVVGVPTPVLHWYKDGKEIKAGDIFALTANPDDPTSLGTYTCEAVNCMGKTYSSSRVHVVGKGSREGSLKPADNLRPAGPPPVFSKELLPIKAKIGDTITLACKVTVPPWPKTIVWYNHEGRVDNNDKYHIMEDGLGGYMLEVSPVELDDEGEWKCVATSSEGAMGISKTQVSVSYPKNFRKPRFLESLKAILTEEGLVSFECKVVGFPTPQLRWFKDGQELRPGDVYQLTGTNSLGSYSCIAKNCMGEATSSAELTVEDIQNQLNEEERLQLFSTNQPPKFIQGLKSCEGKINEEFRFTVQVSISPEPTVTWYRDDEHVFDSDRYHTSRETLGYCHLDIRFLEIVDQAEWKCVATNEFGHSVTSCFLKLSIPKHFKKPRFLECLRAILSEEGAVNLECKVIGVPQPVLKWYKDGEELKPGDIHRIISGQDGTCCLGTYTCEAHNCMGTVASSASLLGFEDRMLMKTGQQRVDQGIAPAGHIIARNPSLSTIHEERTSQMYDTPATERSLTVDERPEISFSFDGKEVSVSLYETPDLTEEEALQVVEMYADQLSEHVSEHNVVDLPPMRFVKESSHSGKLLMEAVVIDVTGDYFTTAEDDLRTDADLEELSITDDAAQQASALPPDLEEDGIPFDRLNSEFMERALAPTVPYIGADEVSPPKRPPRRKSESNRLTDNEQAKQSSDTYHSISQSKGANGAGKSSQPEDDRSESFSDAQASEFDTPSKYETFVSARGSIPKMKEEEFAYQVAAIEEQRTELLSEEQNRASIKSSPPELVRNTQIETKKRKGEAADEGVQLEHSESKVESSTQTGSLKKKVRTVESGQGDSFENILENVLVPTSERVTTAVLETDKLEQIREGEDLRQLSSAEKIDKDDSYSEEGDGLKTRGNVEVGSEDRKDLEEQKARSKTLKRKGSKKVQSEKLETVKSDGKSAVEQSQQTGELNDSLKGESATKKKRLSATDLDLPTLPTLEKHPELPKPQAQSSESDVLEALTKSLQDIQKGLTSVEEKVISENIDEPASAISSLSVLETLSQPIHNIQKGLALVEQHSGSSSEEHSTGKTGLILEKLAQPIQEFQRGLELVEEKAFTEKAEESLLERTILQNVAQPVEELKRGMALIQQQAILESAAEIPEIKSNTHGIIPTPSEKVKNNEKLVALQGLWQSILEIQTGISILQQQALSEVSGELSSESAGMRILSTLEKPLQELKQHVTVVEQQVILEDSADSKGRQTEIPLEGVYQPIQELQKGLALVEQQAAIEAEDGFEPDIMRCSILKTLSKPIKELEKHLVEIKNTSSSDIPLDKYARSSPELQTLEQSIQQLTREIVTIAKLAVLKKKSESDSLATLGNLAPPLLKLQKELVQVERSIVFENLEDPENSSVSVPSLKKLSFPLTELHHGLSEIKQQLEQDTSDALTPGDSSWIYCKARK
ncbi:titin [Anabrus simplex]|uniref:titin n=1 Tax=Anabrus simplex TaxID=316456 RepID=UPI0035A32F1D